MTDSLYDPNQAIAARVPKMAAPVSFLKPMTPYGVLILCDG